VDRPIRDRFMPRLAALDRAAQRVITEMFEPGRLIALVSGIPDRMHGRREVRVKVREGK